MLNRLIIGGQLRGLASRRSQISTHSLLSTLTVRSFHNTSSRKLATIPKEPAPAPSSQGHTHGGVACSGDHGSVDFGADHDHVHLRESETEQNDSYTFGKLLDHKHDHSHGPNSLLVLDRKAFFNNPGVRITWIGLLINVGMAVGKFTGGIVFHSQALMADSVHAMSDLVSDLLTLTTVGLAARGPNQDFPYGYGKVETVGSLAVSSILTMAGLSIGWASLVSIVGPVVPHAIIDTLNAYHIHLLSAGHSHSHGAAQDITNVNAAWIAGASIVAKEWIFRATSKVAKETNSKVLLANAWHHRVDSMTSLVALVTITSGHFLGITSLDAVGGLLVSGLVIKAGFSGIKIAVNELIDRSVPKHDERYVEVETKLQTVLNQMLSNNNAKRKYSIHKMVLLTSGPNMHAKVTLEVPIQRWDNVLGINEFEIVSHHVKEQLLDQVENLRSLTIEYVAERPVEEEEEPKIAEEVSTPKQEPAHSHSHADGSVHNHKH
ncbi:hypothetical protein WICPIJ_002965 [Wickerhamomyces pijperi]|uniref:Cation efflux protein transmembrane domain-containing protein n=1 Tax=Wickerhamomyces pijperi TaxID=599730 RepID=A0A9P8TPN4_WICPI|nr:hypothetical protein WICPIJ_002965 [Wickerhamomyces pijperi]